MRTIEEHIAQAKAWAHSLVEKAFAEDGQDDYLIELDFETVEKAVIKSCGPGSDPYSSMFYTVRDDPMAGNPRIVEGTVVSVEDAEETALALPLQDKETE